MAIVATGLTAGSIGGAGTLTHTDTVSISPTVGRVYLLVAWTQGKTTEAGTTTATGCGLTWTEEDHKVGIGGSQVKGRLTFLTGVGTPSTGKITITWVNGGYAMWSVLEFNGVSGIRQLTMDSIISPLPSPHVPTITLSSFADAANGTFGAFITSNNIIAITPGAGFTALHDTTNSLGFRLFDEYRADNDTTVDMSQVYGGTVNFTMAGLELVAGVAGTQTVIPDSIATAEAIGVPQVNVSVAPTTITSAEAFGTLTATVGGLTVYPNSIASLEAIGTPTVTGGEVSVAPTTIATAEAFGTLQVNLTVTPSSIVSAEAFGTLEVSQVLIGATISAEETLTALVEGFDSRQD